MGTICRDILTTWNLCTVGDGDVYINETEHTQRKRENDLALLDKVLG